MVGHERLICSSAELVDGGDGVRFQVTRQGGSLPAFVVRCCIPSSIPGRFTTAHQHKEGSATA